MTLCIYHGNCADGFGAAWVVRKALGEGVVFHPGVYQTIPPYDKIAGNDVILVDFSYKRPIMEQIVAAAKSVLVLDHHKTAAEDLKELPGAEIVFDMERSGATIAWDYFYPGDAPPPLIKHIEDRDLWRFKLPGTREIQANIFSHPYDFSVWDNLMTADPLELFAQGVAIERKHFKDINELLAVCKHRIKILGHDVPAANLPYIFASDAGHIMAKGELFAATYYDAPDGRVFSLRSVEGGMDVSEIAKQFGGGGHKHAAGFKVPFARVLAPKVVDPATNA